MYSIYELIDPTTNEPKYIGYTSRTDLTKRLYEHLRNRKNDTRSHKRRWINKLESKGYKPIIRSVISNIETIEEALKMEQEVIKKYKESGYKLTNGTSGGEISKEFTQEVKDRISESLKEGYKSGKYQVWCKGKKIGDKCKRKKPYDCSGEKNVFYGKKHSSESKKKMSEKHKKHDYTIEQIKKLYLEDGLNQKEISELLGVCRSRICIIIKTYKLRKEKEICIRCGSSNTYKYGKRGFYCKCCKKPF